MDVGEEMIRRGHALTHQEVVKEKMEVDHVGSLQRMLVSQRLESHQRQVHWYGPPGIETAPQ